jgi:hypothetical protein
MISESAIQKVQGDLFAVKPSAQASLAMTLLELFLRHD